MRELGDYPGSPPDARLQLHTGIILRDLREAYQHAVHGDGHRCGEDTAEVAVADAARVSSASSSSPFQASSPTTREVDAIVSRIASAGYSIDPPTYLRIEAGDLMPDPARVFLDAVISALALSQRDADRLLGQLAFDIVRCELGADVALRLFSPRSQKESAS